MKTIYKAIILGFLPVFILSCGSGKKEKEAGLVKMKAQLEKLKNEKAVIDTKIAGLEEKISQLDSGVSFEKPKLVSLDTVRRGDFSHYVTLQGNIDQKGISYITPAGQPGQIKAIYVKQGDQVRKGQLILKLDNSVALQNVAAIKEQLSTVSAQLDLARSVYERQKNLWNHNIGTEVQLLQAKTNVESLEGQVKTIQANARATQAMADQSNVYSDVNGVVDEVTAHVGETFNGNPLTGGYIRIVNKGDTKVAVVIPENYAARISRGSKVIVVLPDIGKSFESAISFMSKTIGATTRGFTAEIKVPLDIKVNPNQTAIVKILDYYSPNSIAIPVNTVQNDENGKFVLVAHKENGQWIARKKMITIGQFSEDSVEIIQGLQPGDLLLVSGYQGVFDGQPLTTSEQ